MMSIVAGPVNWEDFWEIFNFKTKGRRMQEGLAIHEAEHPIERHAIRTTVVEQVMRPSESYILFLCERRFSIVDGVLSNEFLRLLVGFLEICDHYQPKMDFVVSLPIVLTIPSCLTFFEHEDTISSSLNDPLVVWLLITPIVAVLVRPKQLIAKPRMHMTAKSFDLNTCFSIQSAERFLSSLARNPDESLTQFVQSLVILLSSANKAIAPASMNMLNFVLASCSLKVRLALVKADLIPQLIISLHPLSLSFTEADDIHIRLMISVTYSLWLATPDGLETFEIENDDDEQDVHETVLKQVLIPSENQFMTLLACLLQISPSHQPTMEFLLQMPVFLTVPSFLTFFENGDSLWMFMDSMVDAQREWDRKRGEVRQMCMTVHQQLRMEGIEDSMGEKLRNNKTSFGGDFIVAYSCKWNNLQGMNLPEEE
ncbi:hypothetical protein BLNAU_6640 [Blattamonas nauphoetae]|uniref:Uncharacterized protein n=1 Tax=Blattamonas nauphoetae TaxID=2049346 RepID=A0ABQ9Y3U0_9EUKA|nr:hypothetical protein BLNAU_6640 [Blattamonas nauphoetae]